MPEIEIVPGLLYDRLRDMLSCMLCPDRDWFTTASALSRHEKITHGGRYGWRNIAIVEVGEDG